MIQRRDIAQLAAAASLGPLGLLPRWLSGVHTDRGRVVTTLLTGHPLMNGLRLTSAQLLEFTPRAAIEARAVEGPLQWLPRQDETFPLIVLGSRNAELQSPPSWRVGFTPALRARERTLDFVAGGCAVRAVLLGAGEDLVAVVTGGTKALESNCPVVFDLAGVPPEQKTSVLLEVAELLPPGYGLYDALLLPVQSEVSDECWFTAAPEWLLAPESLSSSFGLLEFASGNISSANLVATYLEREARTRHRAPRPEATVAFDESIRCDGFYPVERDEASVWRWIGPRPRGIVCLPRPFWGSGSLELRIIGTSAQENLQMLRVIVDGELSPIQINDEGGSWRIVAPYTSRWSMRHTMMTVQLHIPVTRQVTPADSRRLGLCISELRVISQ